MRGHSKISLHFPLTDQVHSRSLFLVLDPSSSSSPEPPLTALQRLTLERRGNDTRSTMGLRGRGRGRGGLFHHDMHRESRGEKRPAEQTGTTTHDVSETSNSAARPSKLAALAAARASNRQNKTAIGVAPSNPSSETQNSQNVSKPLTKLQQKMQANLLAIEQRRKGIPSKEEESKALSIAESEKRLHTLPNGDAIDSLFPVTPKVSRKNSQDSILGRLTADLQSTLPSVPGGSPFLARDHLEAFSKPSPDDLVLRAREGTNLAQKR